MNFIDRVPTRGEFRIEALDKNGNVVDFFEDHNLITLAARIEFAKHVGGMASFSTVNKFKLGNMGHQGEDVLIPKDETTGFNDLRTQLFAEEFGGEVHEVTFIPSGSSVLKAATDVKDGSNNNSTVDIELLGVEEGEPRVRYTINIAQDAFNGDNSGIIFTEAGLFSDDTPIALRCFRGKIKEDSVAFRIIWTLFF